MAKRGVDDSFWGPATSRALREEMLRQVHRGPTPDEVALQRKQSKDRAVAEARERAIEASKS